MKCAHCGQEMHGISRIAHFRDLGFDPLEHCTFTMIHTEKIKPCVSKHRQCELCAVSIQFGTWHVERGKQTFAAKDK